MNKEEKLAELTRIAKEIINGLAYGPKYIHLASVRRYNKLCSELYGDVLGEDPEVREARERKEKET